MTWTGMRLLHTRIRRFWLDQYRVWRVALDWTVWVYFIVPGLWIGGGTYREMWLDPPAWLALLPDAAAVVPLAVFLLFGRLRTFVEEADVLFLTQQRRFIATVMAGGAAYTLVIQAVGTVILFGLMQLWMVKGMGLDQATVIVWAMFTLAGKTLFTVLRHMAESRWRGWRGVLVVTGMSIAALLAYGYPSINALDQPEILAALAFLAFAAWLIAVRFKLRASGSFMYDVMEERKAKLSSTSLLLTPVMEKQPTLRLSRPLVFRRSGRLLRAADAGTMLAEMRMKSFLRKLENVRLWLGFFAVSSTAVLLTPGWLSLGAAAVLPLLAAMWLNRHWKEWLEEPFLAQFRWEEAAMRKGSSISRLWLLAPGVAWLALLAGWKLGGLLTACMALPIGMGYAWLLNQGMTEMFAPAHQDRLNALRKPES